MQHHTNDPWTSEPIQMPTTPNHPQMQSQMSPPGGFVMQPTMNGPMSGTWHQHQQPRPNSPLTFMQQQPPLMQSSAQQAHLVRPCTRKQALEAHARAHKRTALAPTRIF